EYRPSENVFLEYRTKEGDDEYDKRCRLDHFYDSGCVLTFERIAEYIDIEKSRQHLCTVGNEDPTDNPGDGDVDVRLPAALDPVLVLMDVSESDHDDDTYGKGDGLVGHDSIEHLCFCNAGICECQYE